MMWKGPRFAVSAGATVGEMYRRLFLGWGVVLPTGQHPGIGIGGHILGGAFGFLCREYGLAADYLYAVALVTVDASGKANTVIATREASDPNRELWWAHTGAGGGNSGIVTRYWLRSADTTGSDPAQSAGIHYHLPDYMGLEGLRRTFVFHALSIQANE